MLQKEEPDLITLDIDMPEVTGPQFYRKYTKMDDVITSYSIHYTKLYELEELGIPSLPCPAPVIAPSQEDFLERNNFV